MGDASTLPWPATQSRLVPPVLSSSRKAAIALDLLLLQASTPTVPPAISSCNAKELLQLFCLQDNATRRRRAPSGTGGRVVEVPPGIPFPVRSQTASVPWVGPPTGHELLSFTLISLDQQQPRGAATSRAEVASISTQSHTTLTARALFHGEYCQGFVTLCLRPSLVPALFSSPCLAH